MNRYSDERQNNCSSQKDCNMSGFDSADHIISELQEKIALMLCLTYYFGIFLEDTIIRT